MEQLWQFTNDHLTAICFSLAFLIMWFTQRELTLVSIKWLAGVLNEPDGNGGKASISRVVGAASVVTIIHQSYQMKSAVDRIPPADMLWDVFLFSIGYMMLSKALSTVSPAILDFAKGYMSKHVQKATETK